MLIRFILHIEWHRGYRLPRISFKRAPYPGQIVYDRGWGYRKLVPCRPCSGEGYFDAPLNDSRAWIEQNHAADETGPLRAPVQLMSEEERQTYPYPAQSSQQPLQPQREASWREAYDDVVEQNRWDDEGGNGHNRGDLDDHGRSPDHLHYECPFPCHQFH